MPLHGDTIASTLSDEINLRPAKRRRLSDSWSESASLSTPDTDNSEQTSPTSEVLSGSCMSSTDPAETALNSEGRAQEPNSGSDLVGGRILSHVQCYRPALPDSSFYGSALPTEPLRAEVDVIETFWATASESHEDYGFIELNDFTVYKPLGQTRALHMVTLDKLQVKTGGPANETFSFDGTLSFGHQKYALRNISFGVLAIDGYGDTECLDMTGKISIQTPNAAKRNLWYRLGKPANEYRRFHDLYLWLATFTKLFVEFLLENQSVGLADFRLNFFGWLQSHHKDDLIFQQWHAQCGLTDFCTTVVAHAGYLYKECFGVEPDLLEQPIWSEAHYEYLDAIKEQKNVQHDTVVTPFVHETFKRMYFGRKLKEVAPSAEVGRSIAARKRELCLTPSGAMPTDVPSRLHFIDEHDDVGIGRGAVILLRPDPESGWRRSSSKYWYAYVQDVRTESSGVALDVLYLYEPGDTILGSAYYPFKNELFMSDNCACGKDAIPLEAVVGTAEVEWFATNPQSMSISSFFVRQKFRTDQENDTNDIVTLRESDFSCMCARKTTPWDDCTKTYKINDTVLIRQRVRRKEEVLMPARIVEFVHKTHKVRLKLLVAAETESTAPPNELVESLQLCTITPERVVRRCEVEHFQSRDLVSFPYNRGGRGAFYYMLSERRPAWLKEGSWHRATQGKPRLTGLGLFCGGGNFDRGLEEADLVKFKYTVDWAKHALHSYRANVEEPGSTQYFLGSVNDYLFRALKGSSSIKIARVNSVTFISAGSPCPGFSRLQANLQSDASLRNASLVASVVAHVDLYSPEYMILENVSTMTNGMGANKDENVFAQVLASLVALGYQVQHFLGDSWSYGSSQQRTRVFIVASAPGSKPLGQLPHSHDHPTGKEFRSVALGKSTNELKFGIRRNDVCPFRHISPPMATSDLPDIGDSMPQICIPFPDHRTVTDESFESRERIKRIPIYPHGMGLAQAIRHKEISSGEALEFFNRSTAVRKHPRSHSYSRVFPDGLFPTFVTALHIACGKNGRSLHWEQPRPLTVLETKRGQGFLDHEVIIGKPPQQMKIIGNSVDRNAAFALGLALRESWLGRWDDEDGKMDEQNSPIDAHVVASPLAARALRSTSPDSLQVVGSIAVRTKKQFAYRLAESAPARTSGAGRQALDDELAQDDVEGRYTISSPAIRQHSQSGTGKSSSSTKWFHNEVIEIDDSSSSEADVSLGNAAKPADESHGLLTPAKDPFSKGGDDSSDVEYIGSRTKATAVGSSI